MWSTFNEAVSLLEVRQQSVPKRVPGQQARIADDDDSVPRSASSNTEDIGMEQSRIEGLRTDKEWR